MTPRTSATRTRRTRPAATPRTRATPPAAWASDHGSMTIEVAFLLVLLVVPLFYLVGTVGRVQAGAYAVTAAAREAGRAFATADDLGAAPARAEVAAALVYRSHGFADGQGSVQVACVDGDCLAPGTAVEVSSQISVELPLVPDFMRGRVPTAMTLTSHHTEPVDAFRGGGR
ncbi:pilus assembly protein [Serinicoccus kebangsaanensis]|uniref:pilus assembly protein n=1 Tax=Serinicoccus kebangsaanensis TaxID=2602069 RepID=UPI00124CB543|nr:pilus assembly protein [Serinicoccus kebangsaanensis]